jgi:inner membrane protein
MSSAAAHSLGGLTSGLMASFLDQNPEEERLALGAILTASALGGSKLPDILEPAIHSHHRKFFHSRLFFAGTVFTEVWLWNWRPETFDKRCLRATLCGLLIGYCSHLLMDMTTPRGLPLIGI